MTAVGIVAHLAREEQAWALADSVQAAELTYDDGTLGATGNHRRVWRIFETTRTEWAVVLEDDAIPCPQFRAQLDAVLAAAPTPIVSLYLGTSYPTHWQPQIAQATQMATREDAAFITAEYLLHAVGVAIRTDLLPDMNGFLAHSARRRIDRNVLPLVIDEAITEWAQHRGHPIGYTWPSLVDHADTDTLAQHQDGATRDLPRKAWRHGTRTCWNRDTVTLSY